IATAKERIPGSIDNDVTGVSECSQQRGNLKDDGYMKLFIHRVIILWLLIKSVEVEFYFHTVTIPKRIET
ncbi:hypothetical protein V2H77_07350, partial [Photorhabdus sp. P32]|uniref:hypothetical protein n=1 Tax=Photorhabdus sp. P32 TaxID=3117549 RepID=UPI00311B05B1